MPVAVPTDKQGQREWKAVAGTGYQLGVPSQGVQFDLTRVRREHGTTIGLLTVRARFRGARTVIDDIVSSADFNLNARRGRTELANHLHQRARTTIDDVDWLGHIEEFCLRVLECEDAGEAEVPLQEVPLAPDGDDTEVQAGGLVLLRRQPVVWFGDGGCGKSYLALYAAVDLVQGHGARVLYCDWEFDGDAHRRRLMALVGQQPDVPGLFYRRCDKPLCRDITRIREIVATRHINYLVCDSVGFACDGTPEAAEAATGYFRALRELGPLGSLHLAHINKGEQGDQKPFGSAFWHNGARATYFLKRTDAEPTGDGLTVGLYNRKSSMGKLRAPRGMRIEFGEATTMIRPGQIEEHAELASKLPIWQRMAAELKRGPQATDVLAESLGVSENTIRGELKRRNGLFLRRPDQSIALREG